MPVVVPCPKCGVKLSAPDSAAGANIRCPKFGCAALVAVPDFVPVEPVPEPPPRPKPRPVVAAPVEEDDDRPRRRRDDEDDPPRKRRRRDEDDYDHDRPRRRRRASSGGGGKALTTALLICGGLALLGGLGYGVYYLVGKGSLSAKKTPVPAGWQQFTYKSDGFKAYFPKQPQVESFSDAVFERGIEGVELHSKYLSGTPADPVQVRVIVVRYKSGLGSTARDRLKARFRELIEQGDYAYERKSIRWLGVDGEEFSLPKEVLRIVFTDSAMYVAGVRDPNGGPVKPEDVKGFFDNFELLR